MNTNQPNQPQAPQNESINTPSFTQTPVRPSTPKKKAPWLLIFIIVFLLGVIGVLGYEYYKLQQSIESKPAQIIKSNNQFSDTIEDKTKDWEIFTNTEYNYSIKYPVNLTVEENGKSRGNVSIAPAIVVSDKKNSDSFDSPKFSVSVRFDNKNFDEIVNTHYRKLANYSINEVDQIAAEKNLGFKMSNNEVMNIISQTTFNNYPAYQYTILGSTIDDGAGEGVTQSEEHQYIWVEKDDRFYLISFTNTQIMRQILSTFKFTDSQKTDEMANWKLYSDDAFSIKYPQDKLVHCKYDEAAFQLWRQPFPCTSGHDIMPLVSVRNLSAMTLSNLRQPDEKTNIDINGMKATKGIYKYTPDDGPLFGIGEATEITVPYVADQIIIITLLSNEDNDLTLFNQILSTFEFTK